MLLISSFVRWQLTKVSASSYLSILHRLVLLYRLAAHPDWIQLHVWDAICCASLKWIWRDTVSWDFSYCETVPAYELAIRHMNCSIEVPRFVLCPYSIMLSGLSGVLDVITPCIVFILFCYIADLNSLNSHTHVPSQLSVSWGTKGLLILLVWFPTKFTRAYDNPCSGSLLNLSARLWYLSGVADCRSLCFDSS